MLGFFTGTARGIGTDNAPLPSSHLAISCTASYFSHTGKGYSHMSRHSFLARFDPAVPRNWLLIFAGVMWSAIGILLCYYALTWVTHPATTIALAFGLLGLLISIPINLWGFSKLAHKNIDRILEYKDRVCAFAFQAWKGYLTIAIMMTGGILLRHSAIPRQYLAVLYAAIGGGLLESSVHYYVRLGRLSFGRAETVAD